MYLMFSGRGVILDLRADSGIGMRRCWHTYLIPSPACMHHLSCTIPRPSSPPSELRGSGANDSGRQASRTYIGSTPGTRVLRLAYSGPAPGQTFCWLILLCTPSTTALHMEQQQPCLPQNDHHWLQSRALLGRGAGGGGVCQSS